MNPHHGARGDIFAGRITSLGNSLPMPEEPEILRGHPFKVRLLGALSGLLMVGGGAIAGWDNFSGHTALGMAGQWAAGTGLVGLVVAGIWVGYARCPDCGAFMTQGEGRDPEKYSGIFVCPECGKSWRTQERSRIGSE